MAFTIFSAKGEVVVIEEDYGNAEEYKMFLNEVAEIAGDGLYTIAEATAADYETLKAGIESDG